MIELHSDKLTEITEEEYNAVPTDDDLVDILVPDEKDLRIAELERENAALLFELLTGEAFVE